MTKIVIGSVLLMSYTTTAEIVKMSALPDISLNFDHVENLYSGYTDFKAAKMVEHGCWCKRDGGDAVDEADSICKQWHQARHCLNLEGGACSSGVDFDEYDYDATASLDDDKRCDQATLNACQIAMCAVDHKWMMILAESEAGHPHFNVSDKAGNGTQCVHRKDPQTPRRCEGTAPDVKIVAGEGPKQWWKRENETCTFNPSLVSEATYIINNRKGASKKRMVIYTGNNDLPNENTVGLVSGGVLGANSIMQMKQQPDDSWSIGSAKYDGWSLAMGGNDDIGLVYLAGLPAGITTTIDKWSFEEESPESAIYLIEHVDFAGQRLKQGSFSMPFNIDGTFFSSLVPLETSSSERFTEDSGLLWEFAPRFWTSVKRKRIFAQKNTFSDTMLQSFVVKQEMKNQDGGEFLDFRGLEVTLNATAQMAKCSEVDYRHDFSYDNGLGTTYEIPTSNLPAGVVSQDLADAIQDSLAATKTVSGTPITITDLHMEDIPRNKMLVVYQYCVNFVSTIAESNNDYMTAGEDGIKPESSGEGFELCTGAWEKEYMDLIEEE